MTLYVVTKNGGMYDIFASFEDAVGSYRIAQRNREYGDTVQLECWVKTPPSLAKCVWRYNAKWSKSDLPEKIGYLPIPDLIENINKYKTEIED